LLQEGVDATFFRRLPADRTHQICCRALNFLPHGLSRIRNLDQLVDQ
jgi:hypothetical protein